MQKKKICFVAENAVGGVIYVIKNLITALHENFNFGVLLINYEWRNVTPANYIFENNQIEINEIYLSQKQNKYKVLKKAGDILSAYNLIVASSIYEITAYNIAKLNIPLVLMIHGDTETEIKMSNYLNKYNIVDLYIPISQKIFDSCEKHLQNKHISYLRHVIPEFKIETKRNKEFTIIFVGRYNKTKGADKLTEIANRLYEKDKTINYILITDGVNEKQFKKDWKPIDKTKFYHNIPNKQVQSLFAQSHIILSPSRNEGLPLTLIEALRQGVVPVSSNLETGFQEVITQGENGFRCNFQDTECFVEKILILKNNTNKYNKLSLNAKKYTSQYYDYKINTCAYKNSFFDLLNSENKKKDILKKVYILGKLDKPYISDNLFSVVKNITKFKE